MWPAAPSRVSVTWPVLSGKPPSSHRSVPCHAQPEPSLDADVMAFSTPAAEMAARAAASSDAS